MISGLQAIFYFYLLIQGFNLKYILVDNIGFIRWGMLILIVVPFSIYLHLWKSSITYFREKCIYLDN